MIPDKSHDRLRQQAAFLLRYDLPRGGPVGGTQAAQQADTALRAVDGGDLGGDVRAAVRVLECGILAHGFLRLRCGACGHDKLLAFSCKRRGFCPSCGARRMAQTAAHLVDHVIPRVPVRQWVLSLPIPLRVLLAAQPELVTPVLQVVQVVQRGPEPPARPRRAQA